MTAFLLFVATALGLGGWLVHRQFRQAAPSQGAQSKPDAAAWDRWQRRIRIDTNTDYTHRDPRVRDALQREEERQRPQEGRN